MPYYVIVSGLPSTVKKQKMVHFLRQFVFKKPFVKFWIESLTPTPDTLNQMVVRFDTRHAAENAAASLHDYTFQHTDQQIYILKCCIRDEPAPPAHIDYHIDLPEPPPTEFEGAQSPERSRSPHLDKEISKIELEIELTNRKRMLVEAERQLIVEQKRLEMLQQSSPHISQQSAPQTAPRIFTKEESEALIKQLPKKKERKRPQDQNNRAGENRGCKLYWPCRIICKEMNRVIRLHVEQDMRLVFNALLRTHIKQRITDILQGEVIFNTKRLIAMYRQTYPSYTDVKFILTIRDMILQGQVPEEFQQSHSQFGQHITGPSHPNMSTHGYSQHIDPVDLPIHELSNDLDDWTEECDGTN